MIGCGAEKGGDLAAKVRVVTSILERLSFVLKWPAAMLLSLYLLTAPLAADIAVVTGESTPIDAIDEAQAKALWLGTIERVGGTKLYVTDRSDAEIRAEFYSRVLHKTRGQVKAIRAKRTFQHGIAPPPELPNDESVLSWVRERENRLGYVNAEAVDDPADDSLKVLLIIKVTEGSEQP